MNIEIQLKGKDVQFYQDEDLVYETEIGAEHPYVVEGLLSALGFNVTILDIGDDQLLPDDCMEPFYEEDPIDQIEE